MLVRGHGGSEWRKAARRRTGRPGPLERVERPDEDDSGRWERTDSPSPDGGMPGPIEHATDERSMRRAAVERYLNSPEHQQAVDLASGMALGTSSGGAAGRALGEAGRQAGRFLAARPGLRAAGSVAAAAAGAADWLRAAAGAVAPKWASSHYIPTPLGDIPVQMQPDEAVGAHLAWQSALADRAIRGGVRERAERQIKSLTEQGFEYTDEIPEGVRGRVRWTDQYVRQPERFQFYKGTIAAPRPTTVGKAMTSMHEARHATQPVEQVRRAAKAFNPDPISRNIAYGLDEIDAETAALASLHPADVWESAPAVLETLGGSGYIQSWGLDALGNWVKGLVR